MSSNNNLLLLIIAGVIALIVLHITTSNQTCNDIPVKKVKKAEKKAEKKVVPPVTTESTVVTSSSVQSIKNQPPLNNSFNGASFTGQIDNSVSGGITSTQSPQSPQSPSSLPKPAVSVGSPAQTSPSSSSSSPASPASPVSSPQQASPQQASPQQATPKQASTGGSSLAKPNAQSERFSNQVPRFSENFSYTEQSGVTEGFQNGMQSMESYSESPKFEQFSANDAKSVSNASTGKNPKPDFVIKSASLGNKFGGGNFNVKLTGNSGAVGPNTTNVNGLGVVEGAPDYTLGVTPIISKEKKAKKLTAKDLLPKASKDDWFDMPYDNKQMMRIENENLLAGTATQARIGIDTQGQTLKNASHDLRAAPPNPKFNVGPWFISTIEPDYNIKPIM
jgi:hypothetical protein